LQDLGGRNLVKKLRTGEILMITKITYMKRLKTVLLATVGMTLGLSGLVQAAPLYYTFEGNVTSIEQDNAGIIASAGLSVGSNLTYTLLVDFDIEVLSPRIFELNSPRIYYPA